MPTINAFQSISLDGVMQAPGRADEDQRGGFAHGGWGDGYQDEVSLGFATEGMDSGGGLLFGRRTYEDLLAFWSSATFDNPFTDVLMQTPKYVVSRDPATKLAYPNSRLLVGDGATTVGKLQDADASVLTILGSGELVRSLHGAGLIDRYILQIHPIVLGSGARLFADSDRMDMQLERTLPNSTGIILASYRVRR